MKKLQNSPYVIATQGHTLLELENQPKETDALLVNAKGSASSSKSYKGYSALGDSSSSKKSLDNGKKQAKRAAVPVRVEPKVFFANERTFISWLNLSVLLGSLAIGLLNFGDRTSKIAGVGFTIISVVLMCYSHYLYCQRDRMINNREPGPYASRKLPTIVVIVLTFLVLLNLFMNLKDI